MQSVVTSLGVGQAYRVLWLDRILSLSGFFVCTAIALEVFRRGTREETQPAFVLLAIGLIALTSGISALSGFYNRVTLYANAIEYRSIWSTSWLQFAEIRGRRAIPGYRGRGGRGPRLRIVPKEADLPTLEFEKNYNFDDAFWGWVNKLPDLDGSHSSNMGLIRGEDDAGNGRL
jgi:hypothetical protein